jgi:hypothetical protein
MNQMTPKYVIITMLNNSDKKELFKSYQRGKKYIIYRRIEWQMISHYKQCKWGIFEQHLSNIQKSIQLEFYMSPIPSKPSKCEIINLFRLKNAQKTYHLQTCNRDVKGRFQAGRKWYQIKAGIYRKEWLCCEAWLFFPRWSGSEDYYHLIPDLL